MLKKVLSDSDALGTVEASCRNCNLKQRFGLARITAKWQTLAVDFQIAKAVFRL